MVPIAAPGAAFAACADVTPGIRVGMIRRKCFPSYFFLLDGLTC
jgi:hypothetical protein